MYLLMWLLLVELLGQVATVGYSLRFLVPYVGAAVGHAHQVGHLPLLLLACFWLGSATWERVRMSVPVYQSRMGIPICVRLTTILTDVHA